MAEEYKRTRKVWDASDSHAGEQNEDIWSWKAVVVDGGMSGGCGGRCLGGGSLRGQGSIFLRDPISTGPASSLSRKRVTGLALQKARARNGACRLKPPALGILSLHSATTQFQSFSLCTPYGRASDHPKASPFAQTPTFMDSFGAEKAGESTGIVHMVQRHLSCNLDCQYLPRSSTSIQSTLTMPPECLSLCLLAPQCIQANHVELLVEYCKLRAQLWS
jgi:hypothetical protein